MELTYDFNATGKSLTRDIPTTAALAKGALVMAGTTTGMAGAIVGTAPYVNCLGVTDEAQAGTGSIALGTQVYTKVIISPGAVYHTAFSLTTSDTVIGITSGSSTTNFKFAASDDHFDGGYLYIATGTGIGGLWYCDEATATDLSTLSTMPVSPDVTSYMVKIPGGFGTADMGVAVVGNNLDLNTASTMAVSKAQATGVFNIFQKWIKYDGIGKEELRRDTRDGLTGLNNKRIELYIDIMPASHIYGHPTETQ